MRAAIRVPGMITWLTVLWIALWDDLSWANLLAGLAVAVGVVLFARLDRRSLRTTHFRPLWVVWYLVVLVWKLVESNLRLAWEIVTPGTSTYTSIIAVPMRGGSEAVVTLVANSITLTPGTMTVEIKTEGDVDGDGISDGVVLYVHGMYTRDVEAVRRDVLRLEELALHAFGSPEDYERARAELADHEAAMFAGLPSGEQLRRARGEVDGFGGRDSFGEDE